MFWQVHLMSSLVTPYRSLLLSKRTSPCIHEPQQHPFLLRHLLSDPLIRRGVCDLANVQPSLSKTNMSKLKKHITLPSQHSNMSSDACQIECQLSRRKRFQKMFPVLVYWGRGEKMPDGCSTGDGLVCSLIQHACRGERGSSFEL